MIRAVTLSISMALCAMGPSALHGQEVQAVPSAGMSQTAPELHAMLDAMGIYRVLSVMATENAQAANDLEAELFPGAGGSAWAAMSTRINSATRIVALFEEGFPQDAMTPEQIETITGFLRSETGQRIVEREIAARVEFLDDAAEAAAVTAFMDAVAADDPRIELLDEFITANDLINRNVMGALNSNYAFFQGMADGGAFDVDVPETLMLSEVWSQEPEVRHSTVEWLYSYQFLAYGDSPADDLRSYIALSQSDAGQALNTAIFVAFDEVFRQLSYELGAAAAVFISGEDT